MRFLFTLLILASSCTNTLETFPLANVPHAAPLSDPDVILVVDKEKTYLGLAPTRSTADFARLDKLTTNTSIKPETGESVALQNGSHQEYFAKKLFETATSVHQTVRKRQHLEGDSDEIVVSIFIHADARYHDLVRILYTLGQAEFSAFRLIVRTPQSTGELVPSVPKIGGRTCPQWRVSVEDSGFRFTAPTKAPQTDTSIEQTLSRMTAEDHLCEYGQISASTSANVSDVLMAFSKLRSHASIKGIFFASDL